MPKQLSPLLIKALDDLAEHQNSSAHAIANRIQAHSRDVFRVLDLAAYEGYCQRWQKNPRSAWLWEIPEGGTPWQ